MSVLETAERAAGGHVLVVASTPARVAGELLRRAALAHGPAVRSAVLDARGAAACLAELLDTPSQPDLVALRENFAREIDGAREAGRPLILVVRVDRETQPVELERLCLLVECRPDAIAHARMILIGDTSVGDAVTRGAAPSLQSRLVRRVYLPETGRSQPVHRGARETRAVVTTAAIVAGFAAVSIYRVGDAPAPRVAPTATREYPPMTVVAERTLRASTEKAYVPPATESPPNAMKTAASVTRNVPSSTPSRAGSVAASARRGNGSDSAVTSVVVSDANAATAEVARLAEFASAAELRQRLVAEIPYPVVVAQVDTAEGARYVVRVRAKRAETATKLVERAASALGRTARWLDDDVVSTSRAGPRFGPRGRRPAWMRAR